MIIIIIIIIIIINNNNNKLLFRRPTSPETPLKCFTEGSCLKGCFDFGINKPST